MKGWWGHSWGAPMWIKNGPKLIQTVTIGWPSITFYFVLCDWFDPFLEPFKGWEPAMEGLMGSPLKCILTKMNHPDDCFWFLSPSKCPFEKKYNGIGHLRQIQNTLLNYNRMTILVHFALPHGRLHHHYNPLKYQFEWELNCITQLGQIQNTFI